MGSWHPFSLFLPVMLGLSLIEMEIFFVVRVGCSFFESVLFDIECLDLGLHMVWLLLLMDLFPPIEVGVVPLEMKFYTCGGPVSSLCTLDASPVGFFLRVCSLTSCSHGSPLEVLCPPIEVE